MVKLLGILALALSIAGCVAAQPPYYGYGDPPGYYAPPPISASGSGQAVSVGAVSEASASGSGFR